MMLGAAAGIELTLAQPLLGTAITPLNVARTLATLLQARFPAVGRLPT